MTSLIGGVAGMVLPIGFHGALFLAGGPSLACGHFRDVLRPFTPADIDAMGPILADPEVLRLTGSVHNTAETKSQSPCLDDANRRWYESRAAHADRLGLAIVDVTTDACVGEIVLNDWSKHDDTCSFRILIGPSGNYVDAIVMSILRSDWESRRPPGQLLA